MKKLFIAGIVLAIIITALAFFYFTYISPSADKPEIEKPALQLATEPTTQQEITPQTEPTTQETIIEEEHIQFMVNEIGGYNLHEDPLTQQEAVLQFNLEDKEIVYTIIIIDNYPEVTQGKAEHPDIILHAKEDALIELMQADDFNTKVKELMEEGRLWMELIADDSTLAVKGYKAIYDEVTADNNEITGNAVRNSEISALNWP